MKRTMVIQLFAILIFANSLTLSAASDWNSEVIDLDCTSDSGEVLTVKVRHSQDRNP